MTFMSVVDVVGLGDRCSVRIAIHPESKALRAAHGLIVENAQSDTIFSTLVRPEYIMTFMHVFYTIA